MEFIGNKRGASTRWKERGTIPESAIRILNLKTGVLHDWILTGEGPMRDPEASPQIKEAPADYYSATTKAIADMVEQMDEDVRKDICLSVQKEKLLRDLLRQKESEEKAG